MQGITPPYGYSVNRRARRVSLGLAELAAPDALLAAVAVAGMHLSCGS
jgi:hypothetical protein